MISWFRAPRTRIYGLRLHIEHNFNGTFRSMSLEVNFYDFIASVVIWPQRRLECIICGTKDWLWTHRGSGYICNRHVRYRLTNLDNIPRG